MVVGAFPVAKLASLFIKQISKPIANFAKERAKSHPFFRTYICMPPAQFYNWCEIKSKMWILNMGKPVTVPVLSESMAIELGANLLGEGIIFVIAAGILIAEYSRQVRKEASKENARLQEILTIHNNIKQLYETIEAQRVYIQELSMSLKEIESKVGVKGKLMKLKDELPRAPPPTPPPILGNIDSDKIEVPQQHPENPPTSSKQQQNKSVIHEALYYIERDLLSNDDDETKRGLIINGLNYLYFNSFLINTIS